MTKIPQCLTHSPVDSTLFNSNNCARKIDFRTKKIHLPCISILRLLMFCSGLHYDSYRADVQWVFKWPWNLNNSNSDMFHLTVLQIMEWPLRPMMLFTQKWEWRTGCGQLRRILIRTVMFEPHVFYMWHWLIRTLTATAPKLLLPGNCIVNGANGSSQCGGMSARPNQASSALFTSF